MARHKISRSNRGFRRSRIAPGLAGCAGILTALWVSVSAAQNVPPGAPLRLTLADCIRIGLDNQAAIQVQVAAAGAAQQQEAVARSYFYPQINFQTQFTNASSITSVAIPSPITGPLGGVVADSGAYFGIAKQAGSAAAQAALDNPNVSVAPGVPSFNAARQAVLNSLPATYDVDLLGQNFLTTQVTLLQPLWTGGKIRYRHEQAELGAQAAQYDVEKARQETKFNITRAYLTILLASELIQVADESAGRLRAIESAARSSVDEGNLYVTSADAFRAGSLCYTAESERAGLLRAGQRAYAGLRLAMGLDQQAAVQIADRRLVSGEKELDPSNLLRQALGRRPDLAKAEIGGKVAQLEQQIAKAAYCPDVAAVASFSNIWDDGHFVNPTHPNEGTVGVGVQLPLFAGGRRTAESHRADYQQAQASQVRRLLADLVSEEVQDAYLEYLQSTEQLKLDKRAACEGDQAMQTLDNQLSGGLLEPKDMPKYFQDFILTQQMLTQGLVRYYQSVYNCNLALARIRLVTACDEYQTFVESGGTDARIGDGGRDAALLRGR